MDDVESGQILPLTLAYALIALTLAIVVVDITAVQLQRDRLFGLTDAAALDAAGALDQSRFYAGSTSAGASATAPPGTATGAGGTAPVPLSDQSVRASVDSYLALARPGVRLSAVGVDVPTGSPDGVTAEVTLVATARIPLFSFAVARWWNGVPLRATSRARARADP